MVFAFKGTRLMTCIYKAFRRQEGRESTGEMATSPRRQASQVSGAAMAAGVRPKEPPPMVVQGDFRKVSGISTEIFRQIETVENDHDATTAAALEAVERRGEMVVRLLDPRHLGRAAAEAAKKFLALQDAKHFVHLVEIVKRPGQTLGLYIREGNGLERSDGVFISRIALESAVYNSGCLKVGDEILAVNMVDVTRMSLDDVVIIMSIPRRLVLVTRQRKAGKGGVVSPHLQPRSEHKPPPVVVIKKELREDDEMDDADDSSSRRHGGDGREMLPSSRSRLGLGLTGLDTAQDLALESNGDTANGLGLADLYYNSRPEHATDQTSATASWPYQPPPPPVITEQPKPSSIPQHFQPYDRGYPKTLESLAEKVHAFYSGPTQPATGSSRRLSQPSRSYYGGRKVMPRSGSDQHLPRVEYGLSSTPHTLLRSSLKAGTAGAASSYSASRYRSEQPFSAGTLTRRHRPSLDYASDTEATCTSSPRTSYSYYRQGLSTPTTSRTPTLSRAHTGTAVVGGAVSAALRSNSLPRDHRGRSHHTAQQARHHVVHFERDSRVAPSSTGLIDQEDSDGAVSAPELPVTRKERGRIPSSPSVFTADEYRAWLQRTPSTSAIYERLRASRDVLQAQRAQRFTYSAENLLDRTRQEQPYYSYRPHVTSTLDRHQYSSRSGSGTGLSTSTGRASSMRRMRHLLDLESRHIPNPSPTRTQDPRSHLLDINPAEFLKYKMDKPVTALGSEPNAPAEPGISGLLWVHLLAGRGLRATTSTSAASTPSGTSAIGGNATSGLRDLYCVLECDRVHKARTVVRTGDLVFDWDETFELDLVDNRELDFLIYSWDPQYRHKLCYKGSVHLATLLRESPIHQLALKIEPRGTLYLRLRHTDPHQTFKRRGPVGLHLLGRPGGKVLSGATSGALFGADLETVVNRENLTGGVPGGVATSVTIATQASSSVPIIIRRCVEEVERRGLDIIGLYRLCGSASKKRILREAFERNARTVDLSPDNVPDINVITGVLKDYLRELPEPLFTKCLYQMMVDALSVCLPDDPEGNAKLMFSILDCLPKVNRCTLIFLMDHLALVVSQSERNKMSPQNLAICFGPVLMLQSEEGRELDFNQPINVLRYLLEIWPSKSVREVFAPSPHLLASSQASSLPPSRLQPVIKAAPAVTSSAGGGLWSLGRGVRATTVSRGRKPPETSHPQQQVVIVSSPDSPTSEESSPSPSPESEVKKAVPPLTLQQRTSTLRKSSSVKKSGGFPGSLVGADSLLTPAGRSVEGEALGNLTEDQQQHQIQTPTSSTTTEDSRKEGGREADEEGSDEVKEEDGDDEDGTCIEDIRATRMEEE
ncbi:rho GTPase-activating protein 100F [Schistocerca cancellata]|uniref:rho GTPase-activating protein 100F n=1 Tax=Schistocerca cancellata TaxID=274614 RepID=UPI0021186A21|nr:rho GTPase-activating protein 100F [Schistocerca cancellata]